MGSATIIAALGDGEYSVKVDAGKAHRDAEIARLQGQVTALEAQISGWQATLDAFAQYEEQPARDAVDAAQAAYIEAMRASPPPDAATVRALITAHSKALQALFEVRARAALLRIQLDTWRMELSQARKDLARWESIVVEFDLAAWCADYTPDASGVVGSLEVPGEFGPDGTVLVLAPREVPPTLPAGQVVAREAQTGAQAYLNAAILPGWQRHMPTYRAGVITNLDKEADTATVSLDAARSSAQDLQINQAGTLYDVPVRYMTCNAGAFEEDDHVVVEFQEQDWTQPVVIGFVERPRPCAAIVLSCIFTSLNEGSPSPGDEVLERNGRVDFLHFDPRTRTWDKQAFVTESERIGGEWVLDPVYGWYYADLFTKTFPEAPIYYAGHVWLACQNTDPAVSIPRYGRLFNEIGETKDLYPLARYSFDGSVFVGVEPVGAHPRAAVLDAQTGLPIRYTAPITEWLGHAKARGGRVIVSAGYDMQYLRVIDHRDSEILHSVALGMFDVLRDVAISYKHFGALVELDGLTYIRLWSMETGTQVADLEIGATLLSAMSMTDQHIVAANRTDYNPGASTTGGFVETWDITPTGLTYRGAVLPWLQTGASSAPRAGN